MIQEFDDAIERAAGWIVEKRLEAPAVLLLEINKPLSFIMGQSLYFGSPLLAPLFGFDKLQKAAGLLSDHATLENLIIRIEKMSSEREERAKNA